MSAHAPEALDKVDPDLAKLVFTVLRDNSEGNKEPACKQIGELGKQDKRRFPSSPGCTRPTKRNATGRAS